jgi:uncharacterized Zn finger protein
MSPSWDEWKWQRSQKQAPREDGIKLGKAGTTWWGERWIDALTTVLGGASGRLQRGKTYARAGRVSELEVKPGRVTSVVTGSADYDITMTLTEFSDDTWEQVIAAMGAQAQFSAELLAGQMPQQIDEAFKSAKVSLFPRTARELRTDCSCPDQVDPCKHIAATHYVLGEAFDRDPFLLFELRGRTKDEVMGSLRAARGGSAKVAQEPEVPAVKLGKVKARDYDAPRGALPALAFSFEEGASHGAVLRQLGEIGEGVVEALEPVVKRAAERARKLATEEPGLSEPVEDLPTEKPKARVKKPKKR